jgi:ACS family tartrate transporter-like MFS transporter
MLRHNLTVGQALTNPKVLHLCLLFFLMAVCGTGLGIWSPMILKMRSNWTDTQVLLWGTIPGLFGAVAMVAAAVLSDRTRERRRYLVGGLLVGVVGMAITASVHTAWATIAAFSLLGIGGAIANAPFWTVAAGFLTGSAAAGGIAFINSVGNLGGYVGPTLIGFIKERTHSYDRGLMVLAGILFCASILASRLRHDTALEHGEEPAVASQPAETTATA